MHYRCIDYTIVDASMHRSCIYHISVDALTISRYIVISSTVSRCIVDASSFHQLLVDALLMHRPLEDVLLMHQLLVYASSMHWLWHIRCINLLVNASSIHLLLNSRWILDASTMQNYVYRYISGCIDIFKDALMYSKMHRCIVHTSTI